MVWLLLLNLDSFAQKCLDIIEHDVDISLTNVEVLRSISQFLIRIKIRTWNSWFAFTREFFITVFRVFSQ